MDRAKTGPLEMVATGVSSLLISSPLLEVA